MVPQLKTYQKSIKINFTKLYKIIDQIEPKEKLDVMDELLKKYRSTIDLIREVNNKLKETITNNKNKLLGIISKIKEYFKDDEINDE